MRVAAIGKPAAIIQFDELVAVTDQQRTESGHPVDRGFDHAGKTQADLFFLQPPVADRARVFAAMTGVNDNEGYFFFFRNNFLQGTFIRNFLT